MFSRPSTPVASPPVTSGTKSDELARDRLLHAVDQRQLRVPLPRLVHEPRVLERNTEAARERLQQLLIGLAEPVLAIDVLQSDHAGRLAAGDERDEQERLRVLGA